MTLTQIACSKVKQPLMQRAAKVRIEPKVTFAALCMSVCVSGRGQKYDKIKDGYAKDIGRGFVSSPAPA